MNGPLDPRQQRLRLFFALWPAAGVRAALEARRDAWAWPRNARPTRSDALHLTLRFVGAWPRARLPALQAARALGFEPFELWLDEVAVWRNGCAVLLPSAVPAPLLDLQRRLELALRAAGAAADGARFTPHVTLARGVCPGAPLPLTTPLTPLRWPVRRHVLVESSQGTYRVIRAD